MATPEINLHDPAFVCPLCHSPTSLANVRCPICGVNLAIAVARATQKMAADRAETPLLYEADKHLPRFGDFLVQSGAITQAQLKTALERQKTLPRQNWTLGQILLEMKVVTREQLDLASVAQIQQFQTTLDENKKQLTAMCNLVQQLESTLGELAERHLSATNFVHTVSNQLRSAMSELKDLGVVRDQLAEESASELEQLIEDLIQFTAIDSAG